MAIGRPAIETAAAGAEDDAAAAVWVVAVLVATRPKFGRPAVADFTALAAVGAFDKPAFAVMVPLASGRAMARLATGKIVVSPCAGGARAVEVCCAEALPD